MMNQYRNDRHKAAQSLRIAARFLRRIKWRLLADELEKTANELEAMNNG